MTTMHAASAVDRARQLGQLGDFQSVVNILNEGLKDDPNNIEGLFLLGAACFKLNLFPQARESWTRILKLAPDHAKAERWLKKLPREESAFLLNRARTLGQSGDFKGVIRCCNELLIRRPDDVEALFLLGAACFKLDMHARAQEAWTRVLQLSPGHPKALGWMAKLPAATPPEQPAGPASGQAASAPAMGAATPAPHPAPASPAHAGPVVQHVLMRSTPAVNAEGNIEIRHRETFEVLKQVQAATLESADLGGTELRRAELYKANLAGANLYAADLTQAHMAEANLTDANLRSAVLTDAEMSGCSLVQANMVSAFMRGVRLSDANLTEANLAQAIVIGGNFEGSNMRESSLIDADLSGSVMIEVNLSGANMEGINLTSSMLRSANLSGANLAGADLTRVNLGNANLEGANLDGAILTGAFLRAANLSNASLAGADLTRANLSSVNLQGSNLSGADLTDADLGAALLINANLEGANLYRTTLHAADMTGANLEGTNVVKADLEGSSRRRRKRGVRPQPAAVAADSLQLDPAEAERILSPIIDPV